LLGDSLCGWCISHHVSLKALLSVIAIQRFQVDLSFNFFPNR
jgi:hypothetical protein